MLVNIVLDFDVAIFTIIYDFLLDSKCSKTATGLTIMRIFPLKHIY